MYGCSSLSTRQAVREQCLVVADPRLFILLPCHSAAMRGGIDMLVYPGPPAFIQGGDVPDRSTDRPTGRLHHAVISPYISPIRWYLNLQKASITTGQASTALRAIFSTTHFIFSISTRKKASSVHVSSKQDTATAAPKIELSGDISSFTVLPFALAPDSTHMSSRTCWQPERKPGYFSATVPLQAIETWLEVQLGSRPSSLVRTHQRAWSAVAR